VAAGEPSRAEHELAARVIETLLRENYADLSRRVRVRGGVPDLSLPADRGKACLVLPLERDGFLGDFRVRRTRPGDSTGNVSRDAAPRLTLDDVDSALAAVSDPLDRAGVAAFAAECRQALATLRLRERCLPDARARLARRWHSGRDPWSGASGQLVYEALAAAMPHPAYPTSECRLGFSDEDSLRYAPEYLPEFKLCWVAIPRSHLITVGRHGRRPPGWPTLSEVGLTESLAATHDLMPVHPVTARHQLTRALAEAGLTAQSGKAAPAVIAPGTWLRVIPTLSTRTVAVVGQPRSHIKLPLPTSTLGLLNRRLIPLGTLADGALVRSILAAAVRGDAMLGGLVLADEGSYAHAGHPCLAYLRRRLPAGLGGCRIVPVAALLATSAGAVAGAGRPLVIEELASWVAGGDLLGLFDAYLGLLFDLHVRLFVRYGIALEAHQQNTALVLEPSAESAHGRVSRLLLKDFDGALIHLPRLAAALGPDAPDESAFADPRLVSRSDDALANVFITITVHLCAGALAFGLADRGVAPLPDLLGMVRRRLAAALDRHAGWPAASVLRARVLDADRLPGKSMVTAGTLIAKSRTGASDINKFYGTNGPNYLKVTDDPRRC
jgi:siderophore synthetase component